MRRPVIPSPAPAPRRIIAVLLALLAATTTADPQVDHACQLTVTAQKGDTCFSLAATWGLSVTTFLNNNPTISSCSKLTVGANYCIDQEPPSPSGAGNNQASNGPTDLLVSNDGTCGNGITCKGSKFGDCCSGHGWCGGTADHCGSECNPSFGACNGVAAPPAPSPTTAAPPAPPVNSTPSPPRTTGPVRSPDTPGGSGTVRTLYTTITNVERSTSIVFRTQIATVPAATVTNTVVVTSGGVATRTTTLTQTTEETSTAVRTQTQRVTRTMTQTEIDTSIITTITTVTLVVSQTGASQNGEWCTRVTRQASAVVNDARLPAPTQAGMVNNSPKASSSTRSSRVTSAWE